MPGTLKAKPVRIWLIQNDMTIAGLAETIGFTREYLSRMMSGKETLTAGVLLALHKATGLPLDALEDVEREQAS